MGLKSLGTVCPLLPTLGMKTTLTLCQVDGTWLSTMHALKMLSSHEIAHDWASCSIAGKIPSGPGDLYGEKLLIAHAIFSRVIISLTTLMDGAATLLSTPET